MTNSLSRTGAGGMLAAFRLADGTMAAPGVAFLNETGTGFYRAGSGEMWSAVQGAQIQQYTVNGVMIPTGKTFTAQGASTFSGAVSYTGTLTGGTGIVNLGSGQLYKDASGNLGVGTATPGAKLHVATAGTAGSTATLAQMYAGSTAGLVIDVTPQTSGSSVVSLYANTGGDFSTSSALVFETRNAGTRAERMRLDASGNLGIGTTPSAGRLVVRTATTTGKAFAADNTANTGFVVDFAPNLTSIGNDFNNPLAFWTNGTEKMRLDSAGNLGLGVTPSAWTGTNWVGIDIKNAAGGAGISTLYPFVAANTFNDGSSWKYKTSAPASYYQQGPGNHLWFTAPSGTAGAAITFTQAMTLDASGRLYVNTTSGGAGFNLASGSSAWFSIGSSSPASSYATFYKGGTTTPVGYLGTDGGGIIAGASGDNFGIRAEGALLLMAGAAERARIDAAGNLGLGVTPSAWGASWRALDIAGNGAITALSGASTFATNAYNNGTNWIYKASSLTAQAYQQNSGEHRWYTAPSGTAGAAITFTQAMTLDASGNLLVGATANPGVLNKSVVVNSGADSLAGLVLQNNATGSASTDGSHITLSGTELRIVNTENAPTIFTNNGAERMRITGSGDLLVGATSQYGTEKFNVTQAAAATAIVSRLSNGPYNNSSYPFIQGFDGTTVRFYVPSNGGLYNYQANDANLSDQRLKTDIQPATSYLDKICAIPVKTFLYKDQTDTERNLGVMAQDVDAVAPELIDHGGFGETPEGESPYLAVYQTDLQYALMKCIQEQQALITSLTARVAALES